MSEQSDLKMTKDESISVLVAGIIVLLISVFLIYLVYNDDASCKTRIPLGIIAGLWLLSSIAYIVIGSISLA